MEKDTKENYYLSTIDNLAKLFSSIDINQYNSLIINGTTISKINQEFIETLIQTTPLMEENIDNHILKEKIHPSNMKENHLLLEEFKKHHTFYKNIIKENKYKFIFEKETYINNVIKSINLIPTNNKSIPIIIPIFSNYLISFFKNPTVSIDEHLKQSIKLLKETYQEIKNISIIIFLTFPQQLEAIKQKQKIDIESEYNSFFNILEKYTNAKNIYLMNYHKKSNDILIQQYPKLGLISLPIGEENLSPIINIENARSIQKNAIKDCLIRESRHEKNPLDSLKEKIKTQEAAGIKKRIIKDINDLFIKIILKNIIPKFQPQNTEIKQ